VKFFNIDLHVSVIRDLKIIFENLGHTIDTLSLSGHNWVFANETIERPEIINETNWFHLEEQLLDKFYLYYKDKLDKYDGFIVTHTPILAKFYEKFNKPIIVVASTRYEHPFTDDYLSWKSVNDFFFTNKNLILTSNNLFDKKYCELFIDREFKLIESICSYTNAQYKPLKDKGVVYSKFNLPTLHNYIHKNKLNRVSWEHLYSYKCIAHFPYNVSTMSIFEQYYANVPLLFPSKRYTKELMQNNSPLYSELSYRKMKGLPPKSLFNLENDPNNYNVENILKWIEYSDFYRFKNILYFDSIQDLENKFYQINFDLVSFSMKQENIERYETVQKNWDEILRKIGV